ncbi:MAG: hypothetical protein OXR73_15125 [Myxococcales bacterium]|nr:hypothetical protein [Myxococcales bacterium]
MKWNRGITGNPSGGGRWLGRVVAMWLAVCGCDAGPSAPSEGEDMAQTVGGAPAPGKGPLQPAGSGGDTCDLSGSWAVHRVGFASVDSPLVPGAQKSSRWYYLEIEQAGDAITVARGLWCGDTTTGDATIHYSDETVEAVRPLANTDGRQGTYHRTEGGCALELERIYWAYGVQPTQTYLPGVQAPPGRIEGNPSLDQLAALPPMPNQDVVDLEQDGVPGMRSLIVDTPIGSGVRHGLQRGWEEIAGIAERGASDFTVAASYDFQEVALQAMPAAFKSNAFVRRGAPHAARFLRVDHDFSQTSDVATCDRVRESMPHRPVPRDAF